MSQSAESSSPQARRRAAIRARAKGAGARVPEDLAVDLRPARKIDSALSERLYIETMQPLLSRLGAWDEDDVLDRFRRHYATARVSTIRVDGRKAGFLQTSETEADINLDQIHLEAAYRSRGIGSQLIRDLQREAQAKNKTLSLSVVRNNPAIALYERLGFRLVDEDATKLHMLWERGSD
jgi:ribosomal protein S18 acetylase RimI-like enzyme